MCGHMVNVLLLELFELQIALRFADSEVEGVFNCLISICSLRYHVPSALCLQSTQYPPNFLPLHSALRHCVTLLCGIVYSG